VDRGRGPHQVCVQMEVRVIIHCEIRVLVARENSLAAFLVIVGAFARRGAMSKTYAQPSRVIRRCWRDEGGYSVPIFCSTVCQERGRRPPIHGGLSSGKTDRVRRAGTAKR
jgi:hypothetical protein